MEEERIPLEICCGSAEDALQSYKGGALRVELNSDLFHGGLTPTVGALQVVRENAPGLRVMCMVRPREGGFCYTDTEYAVMEADRDALLQYGAQGLVFGILLPDGTVDEKRCRRFLAGIPAGTEKVFHRAFDLTPDPYEALETLIELGFDRILTSGQKPTVPEGAALLRSLHEKAAGRIEILPGGGVTAENAAWCREAIGVKTLHAAMHRLSFDLSARGNPAIYFGGAVYPPEDRYLTTDSRDVAAFLKNL